MVSASTLLTLQILHRHNYITWTDDDMSQIWQRIRKLSGRISLVSSLVSILYVCSFKNILVLNILHTFSVARLKLIKIRERQTDRQRQRDRDRETDRDTERDRDREREREKLQSHWHARIKIIELQNHWPAHVSVRQVQSHWHARIKATHCTTAMATVAEGTPP